MKNFQDEIHTKVTLYFLEFIQSSFLCTEGCYKFNLQTFDSILFFHCPFTLEDMDYLRSHFGLDQTRVGFHDNGEPATVMPPPTKTLQTENPIKAEVLKTMSVGEETRRSGKNRVRHRAFVIATDGKEKVGIGIKMDRVQKTAIDKASAQAKSEMFDFNFGVFDPDENKSHTLTHQVHGKYDGIEVTLIPALKGTGLECSPMVTFNLRFLGIKDCIVMPESSKSNFFDYSEELAGSFFSVNCEL